MKALPNSTFFFLSIFASHSYVLIFSPPAWKQIAVEGCLHGELDEVYASIRHVEKIEDTKIDLLIRCGDFQAVRNENDLESLSGAHQNIGACMYQGREALDTIGLRSRRGLWAAELLNQHKPHYWFSGHINCNFTAAIQRKKDESITTFVALEKCVPDPGPYEIQYDAEWLAITRKFNSRLPFDPSQPLTETSTSARGDIIVEATIDSSIKPLLPSKVLYARSLYYVNGKLWSFQSCLRWMCVNHSDAIHAMVSWSLFLLLGIFDSIASYFVLSYASTYRAYNVMV
ncbi:hypothetical protein C4D60_Mb08t26710 [Musa balbisiana]|uniref:Lariat debranching enzyme C-terminal domain-containing protein n=1 Tax=Musa balbisiana TaxID=52838 RepID=A0A4S8K6Q6_MUSBA|nr:hypothetical protein C4D60_Mb08t26710 [Musa balbisiana]